MLQYISYGIQVENFIYVKNWNIAKQFIGECVLQINKIIKTLNKKSKSVFLAN